MLLECGCAASIQEVFNAIYFHRSNLHEVLFERFFHRLVLKVLTVITQSNVDFLDFVIRVVVLGRNETLLEPSDGSFIVVIRGHFLSYREDAVAWRLLNRVLLASLDTDKKIVLTQNAVIHDHANVSIRARLAHLLYILTTRKDALGDIITVHREWVVAFLVVSWSIMLILFSFFILLFVDHIVE